MTIFSNKYSKITNKNIVYKTKNYMICRLAIGMDPRNVQNKDPQCRFPKIG